MSDEPVNPPPTSSTGKHIYFDDEQDDDKNENSSTQKIIERPMPSTVRVDGSDLITRCKDFLPLLADPNLSNDKDKFDEDIPEIEPDLSSKESGEASSTTTDEEKTEVIKKKRKKKKKKKKKKLKTDDDSHVNN